MTFQIPRSHRQRSSAFTLIELIIVITIIGIMMAFTVPAIQSGLQANKITQAADLLRSQLALAQQTAMKENAPIQVRFFSYAEPSIGGDSDRFRAYQFFRRKAFDRSDKNAGSANSNVEAMEPISPLRKLPQPVVMASSERLSTLCALQKSLGEIPYKRNNPLNAQFISFDFAPTGSTNLGSAQQWYVTLLNRKDDRGANMPDNFATVQIDPFTGSVRVLRP